MQVAHRPSTAALWQWAAPLCGGEVDPVAGLGRASGQGGGQHGLADSGWAHEQHVRRVIQEPQRGQVADQLLLDAGLGGEVEVGQRPGIGQQANRGREASRRSSVAVTSISGSRSNAAVSDGFSVRAASRTRGRAWAVVSSLR
jgi:hypothetical protein